MPYFIPSYIIGPIQHFRQERGFEKDEAVTSYKCCQWQPLGDKPHSGEQVKDFQWGGENVQLFRKYWGRMEFETELQTTFSSGLSMALTEVQWF